MMDLELESPPGLDPVESSLTVAPSRRVTLRGYQARGQESILDWYKGEWDRQDPSGRQAFVAMTPMGGATTMLASCAHEISKSGGKILWVAKDSLGAAQAQEMLETNYGEKIGLEKAGKRADLDKNIIITLAQTLKTERLQEFRTRCGSTWKPDVIFFEDGRSRYSPTSTAIAENYSTAKVLNVTTTMSRPDVKGFLPLGKQLLAFSMKEAVVKEKVLVPPEKAILDIKVDGLTPVSELPSAKAKKVKLSDSDVLKVVADTIFQEMGLHPEMGDKPLKTLVFAGTNNQGIILASELRRKGLRVGEIYHDLRRDITLDPNLPDDEWVAGHVGTPTRKELLEEYRDGKLDVLVNNMCLKESFSEPSIQMVVNMRPTSVEDLAETCIARGQLPYPGKEKVIVMNIPDQKVRSGAAKTAEGMPSSEELAQYRRDNNGRGTSALVFLSWFKHVDDLEKMTVEKAKSLTELTPEEILKMTSPGIERSLNPAEYADRADKLQTVLDGLALPSDLSGDLLLASSLGVPKPFEEGSGVLESKLRQAGWVYCPHNVAPKIFKHAPRTSNPPIWSGSLAETIKAASPTFKSALDEIFNKELNLLHQQNLFCSVLERKGKKSYWFKPILKNNNSNFVYYRQGPYTYWVRSCPDAPEPFQYIFSFDRRQRPTAITDRKISVGLAPGTWYNPATKQREWNRDLDPLNKSVKVDSPESKRLIELAPNLQREDIEGTSIAQVVVQALENMEYSEKQKNQNPDNLSDLEHIAQYLEKKYRPATKI